VSDNFLGIAASLKGSRDTAHAQPQNCHCPLCTAKRPTYHTASISETTTPINMKFQDNIWTTKMCPAMQYYDVTTNPRWRMAAILKIAKSPYLSQKLSDFDEIWYTTSDIDVVYQIELENLENRFFGHNSSTDCLISAKFCMRKQNGM